jgi:hypothetical protein
MHIPVPKYQQTEALERYGRDMWRLAQSLADMPRIGPTALKCVLIEYREHLGVRQLRHGRALAEVVMERARRIQPIRQERRTRQENRSPDVPVILRWRTLSKDPEFMEGLRRKKRWQEFEQFCAEHPFDPSEMTSMSRQDAPPQQCE